MSKIYTLEIRTDIYDAKNNNLIPHTFLYIYKEGKEYQGKGYGFANTEGDLIGPGKVQNDTTHPHNESLTRTIQITETQYQSLMDGIAISKVDPPYYSIPSGAQCTTWAMEQLNDAGIIESDVSVGASNFFTNLVETIQNNPYIQGVNQYTDNIAKQVATVMDQIITDVVNSVEQNFYAPTTPEQQLNTYKSQLTAAQESGASEEVLAQLSESINQIRAELDPKGEEYNNWLADYSDYKDWQDDYDTWQTDETTWREEYAQNQTGHLKAA